MNEFTHEDILETFFKKENIFLIVGASNNSEKYGNKVFLDLKKTGYNVIAINNHEKEVLDTPAYESIKQFLDKIEQLFDKKRVENSINKMILVLVIPPKPSFEVIKEAYFFGLNKVWFQPGSESDEAITFCKDNNIICVHNQCVMIQKPILGDSK